MKPIDEQLRERAAALRAHPESWVQGSPVGSKQQCMVFKGVGRLDQDARRVLSVAAEKYLVHFLPRYMEAKGQIPGLSATVYNDIYAESVYDVIDMLEKAAAAYDG